MNHDSIAAHDTAARYVADRLSTDEEREFETHLLDCPQCVEDVEQQLALRQGLRAAASDISTRQPVALSAAPRGWPAAPRWLQVAAAVLAAVSLALGLSLVRTTSALQQARAGGEEQKRRFEEARASATALERRVTDLEARQTQTAQPATSHAASIVPTAVFALAAVRSGGDSRPINRLTAPVTDRLVVFTVDVPPMAGGPGEYAVDLRDRSGRDIWSGAGFRASTPDTLSIAVDRQLLPDGAYVLELRSKPAAGEPIPVGRFPFEIASR